MSADVEIEVEEITFAYPGGVTALSGLSLRIVRGENVALVGPNGAGKTTLFLCLSGVLRPGAGRIHIGGLDVLDAAQRRKLPEKVGVVFQQSDDQLFNATVRDDVAFGPLNLGLDRAEVEQRVARAIEKVGLKGLEDRVPFHLSGGEKRRTALAGVLAMQSEVLLLDEPSMHLDPRGRRELIQLIQQLENTKLIASHDLEFIVQVCQRAVVLDRGRIVADGPVRQILSNRELMERHGLEVPHSLLSAISNQQSAISYQQSAD
jgi:cobalt/nickel transport system ATP-binding protein